MDDTPRPRVLFESVPAELFDALAAFAPTVGRFGEDIEQIHESDWDLVVSFDSDPETPSTVHVLSFGGIGFTEVATGTRLIAPARETELHARSVHKGDDCPAAFAGLVERTIVATAPPPPRQTFALFPQKWFEAIATVGDERAPYAGLIGVGNQHVLALPDHTTEHALWLSAFLEYLRMKDPVRFPALPAWQQGEEWATPEMKSYLASLDEIASERTETLARLEAKELAARSALGESTATARNGVHRLLTSDGNELVEAVLGLFKEFGFDVADRDEHHIAHTGAKLEDLMVTEPSDGWVCLVEVKGYTKGAKVNEVPKIAGRPSVAFAAEHGRPPESVWHIVNPWRTTDPSTRPPAIPNDNDLASLTEACGCLIDTRDLFRAWRDIQEGTVTADLVRRSLRGAVTRWSWTPTDDRARSAEVPQD